MSQGSDNGPAGAADSAAGRPRRRRGLLLLILVVLLLGLVALVWFVRSHQSAAPMSRRQGLGGPLPVVAAVAAKGDMPIILSGLGAVTPLANITVRTQINGQLKAVGFQEGQIVHEGDFLAQIDARPFQAQLEQAQGALVRDRALLANAKIDLARYQRLFKEDSIAEQQYATQKSLVQQYEGTVRTDQATIDTAKLDLIYCHITAPVTGRVGLRQVDPGNYVQTSDANGLVVLTQLQPMSVIFTITEDNVPQVLARMSGAAKLAVTIYDRSATTKLADGELLTIDNQVDPTTGTVKLRAQFANADLALFPSQFVNARLLLDTLKDTIVIPSAAIQRGTPGTYVYVIKPDDTVTVRPVTLGPANGEQIAITAGLAVGDKIVVDGADKLKEGAQIALPAAAGTAPAPAAPGANAAPRHRTAKGGSP